MNTLTSEGHKTLVGILVGQLGEVVQSIEPTPNIVGNYVEAVYIFNWWVVEISWRGVVEMYPTKNHPSYDMYTQFRGKRKMVAVWLDLGAWSDWDVSRTPQNVAKKVITFTDTVDK